MIKNRMMLYVSVFIFLNVKLVEERKMGLVWCGCIFFFNLVGVCFFWFGCGYGWICGYVIGCI